MNCKIQKDQSFALYIEIKALTSLLEVHGFDSNQCHQRDDNDLARICLGHCNPSKWEAKQRLAGGQPSVRIQPYFRTILYVVVFLWTR